MAIETAANGLLGIVDGQDSNRLANKAGTDGNPVGPVVDLQIRTLNRTFLAYVNGRPDNITLPMTPNRSVRIRYSGEKMGGGAVFYHLDVEAWQKQLTSHPKYDPINVELDRWYNIPDSMKDFPVGYTTSK